MTRVDTRKGDRHKPRKGDRHRKGYRQPNRPTVSETVLVGFDGEGQTKNGKHYYTYIAAVDENGEVLNTAENPEGLTTKQCFEFFLALANAGVKRLFGFSLGYDYSMILRDLPPKKQWDLLHEESRTFTDDSGKKRLRDVYWAGYKLSYLNRKLTVCRATYNPLTRKCTKTSPTLTVWDTFRFHACRFTQALKEWKVAGEKELEFMARMKNERSNFDSMSQAEVKRYCQQECMYMARLARKLITSAESVDLRLKDFYGAGSLSGAFLRRIKINDYIAPPPPEMRIAIAQAFFGGRFEISHVGPIQGTVHNYDISSAYPYQCVRLPCLVHGKWVLSRHRNLQRAIERSRLALVRYRLPWTGNFGQLARGGKSGQTAVLSKLTSKTPAFGPFPFRLSTGDIVFPLASKGGWVWKDEFLAAQRHFPNVEAESAWTYNTECDCQPFKELAELYNERVRVGKDEGPGLTIKLGINGVAGKLMQHKGSARYQSYVYAGNITSGTRAMLLDAIGGARNWWNVLMLATDGVFTRERLDLPTPDDTGTEGTGKPLGGWEHKEVPNGIFLVRPGIFFPPDMTVDPQKLKARGIQRKVLGENRRAIIDHYEAGRLEEPLPLTRPIFVGLKSALTKQKDGTVNRSERACTWDQAAQMNISMNPRPKRERAEGQMLMPWPWIPAESAPYNPAVIGPEGASIKAETARQEDQPDMPLENV